MDQVRRKMAAAAPFDPASLIRSYLPNRPGELGLPEGLFSVRLRSRPLLGPDRF